MVSSEKIGTELPNSEGSKGVQMTTELDVWRSAAVLMREHGDGAAIEAAYRADERLEHVDIDGCALWKRVMTAVDELRRSKLKDGERPN